MLNHGLANILTNGYGFIEDGKTNLEIFSVKFLYSFLILVTLYSNKSPLYSLVIFSLKRES